MTTYDLNYDELDPGIRKLVRLLNERNFLTSDSGDGVSKPPEARVIDVPHVYMTTTPQSMIREAHRLAALLMVHLKAELVPGMIQATFDPVDGSASLAVMDVNDDMLKADRE